MEEEEVQDIIVNIDVSGIIGELQNIGAQNETLIAEEVKQTELLEKIESGVLLVSLLVVALVLYKVRDVFLSFAKKGGLKNSV